MKIAAVFASYNRREVALECVSRLRAQSRPPDLVVVADNASTDGSVEALRGLEWDRLEVVETGGNLGNAGAVKAAMERAFDRGCEAVWILDDDSWPHPEALERLLGVYRDDRVPHPVQVDPATSGLTWPIQVGEEGRWRLVGELAELPEKEWFPSRASWTGALVSRRIRDAVGPVNGELFIRGEDEEYPWRIAEAGFDFACVRGAVLDHPGPVRLVRWALAGRSFFYEPGISGWKLYYKVRNMVWLRRRQRGRVSAAGVAMMYGMAIARYEGCLPRVWKSWWHGVRDGFTGRLGRRVDVG